MRSLRPTAVQPTGAAEGEAEKRYAPDGTLFGSPT